MTQECLGCYQKALWGFILLNADVSHSGRKLIDHLRGVYAILRGLNAPEYVATAGSLHSIYGTNSFRGMDNKGIKRIDISGNFGENSERLVWIFSRINRPYAIEKEIYVDRFDGNKITVSEEDSFWLAAIEAANLIEQSLDIDKYPRIKKVYDDLRF